MSTADAADQDNLLLAEAPATGPSLAPTRAIRPENQSVPDLPCRQ
jgi:hypothetical protein